MKMTKEKLKAMLPMPIPLIKELQPRTILLTHGYRLEMNNCMLYATAYELIEDTQVIGIVKFYDVWDKDLAFQPVLRYN